MKNLKYLLIGATILLSSCEKLVDVEPRNSISEATALSSISGYDAVLVSAYDRLQNWNYWGRDMALLGDVLADNSFAESAIGSGYVNYNRNVANGHYDIWATAYTAINDVNTIIAGIDKLEIPTSSQAQRNQIKGEALALRALVYFDLARVYGYEPNQIPASGTGAGFNKSVVLRLTPTAVIADAQPKNRATVAEVYASIEKDLKDALTLLPATSSSFRLNKGAVNALLGKVYLYAERYTDAVAQFNTALASTSAKLSTAGTYATAFRTVPNPESLFELTFVQSTEIIGIAGGNTLFSATQPNLTNALGYSTSGSNTVADELLSLFETADDRRTLFFNRNVGTGSVFYNWSNKYSSANGAFTDNIKIIRYADVLLMKAEALAELNQYADAAALVVQLRGSRNATVNNVPTNVNIKNYIQDERRRELFFEGHRWFDLKRKGAGISKPAKTSVGSLSPLDYRILAPLPAADVQLNRALPQNPNY